MLSTLPQKKTLAGEIARLLEDQFDGSPTAFGDSVGASRTTIYDWLAGAMPQKKYRAKLISLGIDPALFIPPDARHRLTEAERQIARLSRELRELRERL